MGVPALYSTTIFFFVCYVFNRKSTVVFFFLRDLSAIAAVSCLASPYLLRGGPQLRQAGCQVLGTLTQLHGRRLILHRGNGRLGRGHHLAAGLQDAKTKQETQVVFGVCFPSRSAWPCQTTRAKPLTPSAEPPAYFENVLVRDSIFILCSSPTLVAGLVTQ